MDEMFHKLNIAQFVNLIPDWIENTEPKDLEGVTFGGLVQWPLNTNADPPRGSQFNEPRTQPSDRRICANKQVQSSMEQ